jgi:hypothetical protein
MSRAELERRTSELAARSARQRARLADALKPWQARAARADRATFWMQGRMGWFGFAAGAVVGMIVAARPRLLVASARALAATWPLWLRGRAR